MSDAAKIAQARCALDQRTAVHRDGFRDAMGVEQQKFLISTLAAIGTERATEEQITFIRESPLYLLSTICDLAAMKLGELMLSNVERDLDEE